jgi:glycosyltransferase involved in cell wall biosynthesis
MRIAIINSNRRRIGGAETYLSEVIPCLHRSGHELALWSEVDQPDSREPITLPDLCPSWCVAAMGETKALDSLRRWQPDLIYSHGLHSPRLERQTLTIAAAIFFAHGHYGTCISGSKTFALPVVRPCSRRFGLGCFLHYYPHRCGGLSPITMWREYLRQAERRELLSSYRHILTASAYMQAEYAKHGLTSTKITFASHDGDVAPHTSVPTNHANPHDSTWTSRACRLLYLGRMDSLKGGHILLAAMPHIQHGLKRQLPLVFAGDGPSRSAWERLGGRLAAHDANIRIDFVGWVTGERYATRLTDTDLLVLPSLCPETFGLVGLEAGRRGVPTAAFDVGGIREWLEDGVNGHLAPGDPPTVAGLAQAVVKCLADATTHDRLRRAAREVARRFGAQQHVGELLAIFQQVLANHPSAH